jgi:ankyrin repeat protein
VRPKHDEDNAQYQAVIRELECAGIDVDAFAAIACNNVPRMIEIVRADPKVGETRDPDGRPALHQAVTLDRREIVELLLEQGIDPDVRSRDENTGHLDETALLQAAFWGRLEIAEVLIKQGADVNAKAANGVVPLHEAARMGWLKLARLLLQHGADVNAKNDEGETPLDYAELYKEFTEMSKLLRNNGGINATNK